VLVIVAPAGSLIGHFSSTGIGDDGKDNADFDTYGWYYSRQNLAAKGILAGARTPVPGTDLAFTLPEIPAGRPDNLIANGQRLDMAALAPDTTRLSFVGAAVGDSTGGRATITYTDGTVQETPLEFGDWCLGGDVTALPRFGNIGILQADYRNRDAARDTAKPWLFSTAPVELEAGKRVASITLPVRTNLHVFAIAENGTPPGAGPTPPAGTRFGRAPATTRSS
jgi:hypothetical protein